MRILSLFSGGGLGDYGLELAGMEIAAQVEIDEFCQKILKLRWPDVPKWGDIKLVTGKEIIERAGPVDLISGGFPCQPFSLAGKRKGAADDRNLWPEMFRIISEVRPAWVLAENVPGVLGYVESVVLPELESAGYETLPPLVFPAHALGAQHQRDRVWIVAHSASDGRRLSEIKRGERSNSAKPCDASEAVANARLSRNKRRLMQAGELKKKWPSNQAEGCRWWTTEPNVGRVAHGVPHRVDRLKLLGNGQVVQVVQFIGEQILRFDNEMQSEKH